MKTEAVVSFITTQKGDDLIVSFAFGEYAETSLTLIRTPRYEAFLPAEERGVSVNMGETEDPDLNMLVAVVWGDETVEVSSMYRTYRIDISAVDKAEMIQAKNVLQEMNFDNCFRMKNA